VAYNPLYKAFKAKSFTDKDIILHFYILDVLADGSKLSVKDIAEIVMDEYLGFFDTDIWPDESTIRNKLKEYAPKKTDDDLYYDECNYYMFMDNDSAQKAFEYMKENWIQDETDAGKKYIRGWEAGVCDASVEIYIYITNNMIITTEVQVVSEWSVDSPDYAPPTNHQERVDFINKHF